MFDDPAAAIAVILVLGVSAQWVAGLLKIPSILLLLAAGLIAGPILGWVEPDVLLGDKLFPVVSLGVGLLLFEGGLGLHRSEIGAWGKVLVRLLTVGVLITGVVAGVAAVLVGRLPLRAGLVFGAIMTVTGPTVITPLLRQVRLRPRVARVLRWEGICIDAIGAVLAIVMFEVVVLEGEGILAMAKSILLTGFTGIAIGLVTAALLIAVLGRRMVDDHIQNAVLIMAVVASFAISNHLRDESGLFAATALGIAMANQTRAPVRHVVAFQESLGVLLIGVIFILLGARVEAADLKANLLPGLGVLLVLVFVARPASVAASTLGSTLPRNERLYLAALAPRGIVAASVSALFGLKLDAAGVEGGADLAAMTFVVVAGSVVVYGLAAGPLSRRLHINIPDPNAVALIGAPPWVIQMGGILYSLEVPVLVVATDEDQIRTARHADLLVYNGRLVHRELKETVEAFGVRQAFAVSLREELNAYGSARFGELLGMANVYGLPRSTDEQLDENGSVGGGDARRFGGGLTGEEIVDLVANGASIGSWRPGQAPSERWRPLLTVTTGQVSVVDGDPAGDAEWVVGLQVPG